MGGIREPDSGTYVTVANSPINVMDYGAVGDNVTDDTTAFQNAAATAAAGTYKRPLYLPPGRQYLTTQPITLFDGFGMIGSPVGEREFQKRAVIHNPSSNIFAYPAGASGNLKGVDIFGVCFNGSSVSKNTSLLPAQALDGTGWVLQYSSIDRCGFNFFSNVLVGAVLGLWLTRSHLNNCSDTLLQLSGSDSQISDNFMDSVLAGTPTAKFLVDFRMSTTLFRGNYITCCPNMGMTVQGSTTGSVIAENAFDGLSGAGVGTDGAALYIHDISTSHSLVVVHNQFHLNVKAPFSQYDAVIVTRDASNLLFDGNIFRQEPGGQNIYDIGQNAGTATNIQIARSVYDGTSVSKLATTGTVTNLSFDEWGPRTDHVVTKTTTYTAASGELVLADASGGAWVLTLPAGTAGRRVIVKKTDSSTSAITVTPASGTIDGAATWAIARQYESYTFVSDGTNWMVV